MSTIYCDEISYIEVKTKILRDTRRKTLFITITEIAMPVLYDLLDQQTPASVCLSHIIVQSALKALHMG